MALEVQGAKGTYMGTWRPGGAIEWTSHLDFPPQSILLARGTDLSSLLPSEWEIPKDLLNCRVMQRRSSRQYYLRQGDCIFGASAID